MIKIYGAGMAGLLAANMLRRFRPVIYEAQTSLPNNHDALLRFRTDAVSRATGIPFKKVMVEKAIHFENELYSQSNIKLNNLYSQKVTGEYHQRSISDLRPVERYIAPPNFITLMAQSADIQYGNGLTAEEVGAMAATASIVPQTGPSVISTIPMPVMMKLTGWSEVEFKFKTIWSVTVDILEPKTELYQTIYYPDPDVPFYRVSITGNKVIFEFTREPKPHDLQYTTDEVLQNFGFAKSVTLTSYSVKKHYYGKLLPISDGQRRHFILSVTDQYRIYSLGRFATWRQILMDDVVQDVARIESWIMDRDAYQRRLQA